MLDKASITSPLTLNLPLSKAKSFLSYLKSIKDLINFFLVIVLLSKSI